MYKCVNAFKHTSNINRGPKAKKKKKTQTQMAFLFPVASLPLNILK